MQKSLRNHLIHSQSLVRTGHLPGFLSWVVSEGTLRLSKVSPQQNILKPCTQEVPCAQAALPASSTAYSGGTSPANVLCLVLAVPGEMRNNSPARRATVHVPL